MIKSFRHKGLQAFFEKGSKAGIQPHHVDKLNRQLAVDCMLVGQDAVLVNYQDYH